MLVKEPSTITVLYGSGETDNGEINLHLPSGQLTEKRICTKN